MKHILILLIAITLYSCNDKAQSQTAASSSEMTIADQNDQEKKWKVTKSKQEWKEILSEEQYYILREAGTERPFSSDLLEIKKPGTFICAGCNNALYETEHKFKSGTGWPSFDRPVDGALAYDTDRKIGYERNELLCGTCGGHLGHVFDDGPRETTGKRHCINGDAMIFIPEGKEIPAIIED